MEQSAPQNTRRLNTGGFLRRNGGSLKISFDCKTQLFEGVWSATSRYSFERAGYSKKAA